MSQSLKMPSIELLRRDGIKLRSGEISDYDPLLDAIGDARFVLIGEASHGTHEFYRERAEITKRLIKEKGFIAVAVEADFPDANRVNAYVNGRGNDVDAVESLSGFERFPTWMWRNADVLDFVGWLRTHNDIEKTNRQKVGFYGLDLYSLHASIDAVLTYLGKIDPDAAVRARKRYSCFDHFGKDSQKYGYAVNVGVADSCEDEVATQLAELYASTADYSRRDGSVAEDEFFYATQNARLVNNAENYYRTMYRSDVSSWNLRDHHMMQTLIALDEHLSTPEKKAKIVVWEHNSHLGDASATAMATRGEYNVGELTRDRYGSDTYLIGFTTYSGTVTAANDWGGAAERKRVSPGLAGSYEDLFHNVGFERCLFLMTQGTPISEILAVPMPERAIGVIYRPETERQSHYFQAKLSHQFDALIHIDQTRAVEPLERTPHLDSGEVMETFPTGY